MNILFLLKSFGVGGVEVVTAVLANKFATAGHNVVLWAFYEEKPSLSERLDKRIKLLYGNGYGTGRTNVALLRKALIDNLIQVVVNQWGLPIVPIRVLNKATRDLGIKVISVYHNDPNANGRTKKIELMLERSDSLLNRALLKLKLYVFRQITSASMRYVYRKSDRFMVLSESFITHFECFTGIKQHPKLIVQQNPITIDTDNCDVDISAKSNEVVYVGRINHYQKRISRVIETWALIEDKYPEWCLKIVGDGEDKSAVEDLCTMLGLQRVYFEGFQQPIEYYKRASILMLTSEYEGFGLVLVEGMSLGVIPVVYGSYSAVYDIIENGRNGLIIEAGSDGFHAELMANALSKIMSNNNLRHKLATNAISKSKNYSIDDVYKQWDFILNSICH